MIKIKAIPSANGICIGKVALIEQQEIKFKKDSTNTKNKEIKNLKNAISEYNSILEQKISKLNSENKEDLSNIFIAHQQILQDPNLTENSLVLVNKGKTAEYAFWHSVENFIEQFKQIEDKYFQERIADLKDIRQNVIKLIQGLEIVDLSNLKPNSVVVIDDLTPSDSVTINKENVVGIVSRLGGATSHSTIIAKAFGIPFLFGVKSFSKFKNNQSIILDTSISSIILEPEKDLINDYKEKLKILIKQKKEIANFVNVKTAVTKDGHSFNVFANAGVTEDCNKALENGATGIGLFRTEFLFMQSPNWPTLDSQVLEYTKILSSFKKGRVVIRLLDIGADKNLPYYTFPKEENPFLGNRGIRFLISNKKVLVDQITALLKSSIYNNLLINVPMISTIDEWRYVKKLTAKIEAQLIAKGHKIGKYKMGIMAEVPAVFDMPEQFAKEVDFFSIGTNDLIQYTFAADRISTNVSHLYQPINPAILIKINNLIEASKGNDAEVYMCGEMASYDYAIPFLVGMGLKEFSVTISLLNRVKWIISKLDKKECEKILKKALKMNKEKDVLRLSKKFLDPLLFS